MSCYQSRGFDLGQSGMDYLYKVQARIGPGGSRPHSPAPGPGRRRRLRWAAPPPPACLPACRGQPVLLLHDQTVPLLKHYYSSSTKPAHPLRHPTKAPSPYNNADSTIRPISVEGVTRTIPLIDLPEQGVDLIPPAMARVFSPCAFYWCRYGCSPHTLFIRMTS